MTTLAHNSPVTILSHAHTQNRSYPRKELEPMMIETTNPPNTRAHNRIHTLSPSDITQTNDCSNLPNTRTQPHEPTQIQPRTHSLSPSHTTTPMVIETANQAHDHLHTHALTLVHYLDPMVIATTHPTHTCTHMHKLCTVLCLAHTSSIATLPPIHPSADSKTV